MTQDSTSRAGSLRPWWREPAALLLGLVVFFASAGILAKGWIAPPVPVDPTKPAGLPGGGSFCDPPPPVKSTLERPK